MTKQTTWRGDDHLGELLEEADSPLDAAQARELAAGVLAAPRGHDPTAWHQLVAEGPLSEELTDQLEALLEQVADARARAEPIPQGDRLGLLREELKRQNVTAFLVPRADRHQGEYVPACAERLAWLTGFTGSAGQAILGMDWAALFVDGRYTLQARQQVDTDAYELVDFPKTRPHTWLADKLEAGDVLGVDPWLRTPAQRERLERACQEAGARLQPLEANPIDALWRAQPPRPISPIVPHPDELAGASAPDRRAQIAAALEEDHDAADALLISDPSSVAWLLNIRGGDVPFTPLPLSYALLHRDGAAVELFVDARKLGAPARAHLEDQGVHLRAPDALIACLEGLSARGVRRVVADEASCAMRLIQALEAGEGDLEATLTRDPCALPRARKNEVEREGARRAHVRDGVAMVRFLCWLDAQVEAGAELDEIDASDQLEALRARGERFRGLSFPSISGFGPHGAIVHYRADEDSRRRFEPGNLYLIDSGAQYADGTTDITRTVAIGEPTRQMRTHFTLVLKGHIALSTARFPEGTTGTQLDVLARRPLWQRGLNFNHGTGHGVGSYLSVHEGPQQISSRVRDVALEPGMILSNEPGYYQAEAYGIRIENLILVTEPAEVDGGEQEMLGFEPLTLAPIDVRLIDAKLLEPHERAWLNDYHRQVRDTLAPLLDEDEQETRDWLEQATRSI